MQCFYCKSEIINPTKYQRDSINARGRTYCDKQCSSAASKIMSSVRMAETNRRYASERMKINNPMYREPCRKKMSETLKRIGHQPCVRGGNGTGMTVQQKSLIEKIESSSKIAEFSISLGKLQPGYPTNYKIDIGIPEFMIAVEIDGNSHLSIGRQQQDVKKEIKLIELGWKIFRFSNQDIDQNLETCARLINSEISRKRRIASYDNSPPISK